MFRRTDSDHAPWTTIKSNDKKRARINAMRHFLNRFDYEDKDCQVVFDPDPKIVQRGEARRRRLTPPPRAREC